MKILCLSIIIAIVIVSVISSSNSTFAQNVTNSSNSIMHIPPSILNSPAPTLTPSENQTIVGIALSVPGLQNWSHDWRYVSTGFLGNNKLATAGFEWQYAIVYLKASSSSSLIPCDNNNDWSAMVTVDLTTMKAVSSNYPTMESHNCNYTISGGPDISKVSSMMGSPLQQFKSGVAANSVECQQGLHLVIKSEDVSPACVKLDAAYMLIKRGWAVSESAYPGGDAQFALNTNSTIMPAHLPRSSGVRIPYYQPSLVVNHSGFDGIYNETFQFRGTQNDYVLKPGSTGIITFKLEAVSTEEQGQDYSIPLPKSLNLTNYAMFYHEITSLEDLSKYPGVTFSDNDHSGGFTACSVGPAGGGSCIGGPSDGVNSVEAFVTDHPGVDVLFEPPSEVLPLGMNATSQVVTMTITADNNAPRGTYLVMLPSVGVDSFLLTVGDKPYHE